MSTYSQSKAAALKKALKSEKNARAMAERQAKVGKAPEPVKATETKADKQRVARSKARRMAAKKKVAAKQGESKEVRKARIAQSKAKSGRGNAKVYSTKDGLPTGQKKAPKGGDKLSKAAAKSTAKRAAVKNVERRVKPRTTARNVAKAITSGAKPGTALNRVATMANRAGAIGMGVATAMAGEKYMRGQLADVQRRSSRQDLKVDGGFDARVARRKAAKSQTSAGGSVSVAPSLRGKSKRSRTSTSPSPSSRPQTRSSTRPSTRPQTRVASKPQTKSTNQPKGAMVQEGPTRTPIKKKKVNRGYQNYQSIMNVEGMACGGKVKKYEGGGIISRGYAGMKALGQAMMQQPSAKNQPKVVSDNQAVKQQAKEARMKGMYGRQLVPSNIMRAMKQTRGK